MSISVTLRKFFTRRKEIDQLVSQQKLLIAQLESAGHRLVEYEAVLEHNRQLRAQLVQLRVSQSTFRRAGWEVMCFIPEEALEQARNQIVLMDLIRRVTTELVTLALGGVVRIRAEGKVCALVFEPLDVHGPAKEPRFVQALFDKDGQFKLSGRCWDTRDEEARIRRAAGCGGFGV